jgi:Peptidase inhibitor family I36
MINSLLARAGTFLGCAVVVVAITAGTAQAQISGGAPRFSAEATSYQNAVIAKAMTHVAGGIRVSASEVTWDSGAVILSVPASADAPANIADSPDNPGGCPGGYFCVWTAANYGGVGVAFLNAPAYFEDNNESVQDYWIPWGDCNAGEPGCDVGEHSFANESGFRTWLEQYQDSGHEDCISGNGQSSSDFTGPNSDDYWILMTTNSAVC